MNELAALARFPEQCSSGSDVLSLAEIVRLAQRGDAAAFAEIYRLHSGRVYGLCLRMVKNRTEAEDLTQEAFVRVLLKIQTFRGESAFSSWLHRVAVNVVLMRLRKKVVPEISLDETSTTDGEEDKLRKTIGGPDLRLTSSVDRVNLERAVNQLPPGYRCIFILHDVEGYKHQEIATMLGCSVGNSKAQLHKGRMRLRTLLQPAANGVRPKATQLKVAFKRLSERLHK